MALTYSDILKQNPAFQRAVNLSLDLGSLELVDGYIPTSASAAILLRYLRAARFPSADRASILIGPYGKGKSHTLFVALAVLSEQGADADATFERLATRLENVNPETAALVRCIRRDGPHLLPVVINDRYLDIRQAFLASLKGALSNAGLSDLMPDNYFRCCLETIGRWKRNFPETHEAYIVFLRSNGENTADFEARLKQFDAEALKTFRVCHRTILSGAEFDPLIESDVPALYRDVSQALLRQTDYGGLFVVFDEFAKYLESADTGGEGFKALQDLAEMASRSNSPALLLSCITHKAISEYASQFNQSRRISFRTVEGRFEPIYFTSTFEGSFSLIAGALGRNRALYERFAAAHQTEQAQVVTECAALGCFAGYESSVEQITAQSFPMHPLTALALMKLSEQAAQNERTLFTFLSGAESPLTGLIKANRGEYRLATVPMVYDYFHETIRENSYDRELRDAIVHADSLIPTLSSDEGDFVRAVVLFFMVADHCLLSTKQTLLAALQWDEQRFQNTLRSLEKQHQVYTRRSDGVICLMRSTAGSVRRDIEQEMTRRNRLDIADQLAEVRDPGYTIPRRYNDRFEMVRYFLNVYVSPDRFLRQKSSDFLSDKGFADGYVVHLLGRLDVAEAQAVLRVWNDPRVVLLLPEGDFKGREAVEECAAIRQLMEKPSDEVAAEELGYYYEDTLQMVSQAYEALFQKNTLLVTTTGVTRSHNLSAELSALCEEELYSACPVICHEMINRSVISSQMKQTRAKVIDAVLQRPDFLTAFPVKSAEGPVIRAVLGHLQEANMQAVMQEIQAFLAGCEEGRQPLAELYDRLMGRPYGMRKGVIPILLAYALRDDRQRAVLYNHRQELPFVGESLNALDEHYEDYELMVDRGSAAQAAYIQCLHDQYTPGSPVPDVRTIYEALCRIVRALPRSARANRRVLSLGETVNIAPAAVEVRSVLIRFDSNAREVLLQQLPKAVGTSTSENCAHMVSSALKELLGYTRRLAEGMKHALRLRLKSPAGQSVRGMMTVYLQRQSAARLNHSYSGATAALLRVFRSEENHTDAEWMNMIAVALTGLPVEDWSDRQVEEFGGMLDAALQEIESVPETANIDNTSAHVRVTLDGLTMEQALPDMELEGLPGLAYESVRSALNEFGDSLTTDEKLLILSRLLLHVNG